MDLNTPPERPTPVTEVPEPQQTPDVAAQSGTVRRPHRLFALPAYALAAPSADSKTEDWLEPGLQDASEILNQALGGAEFRGMAVWDRLNAVLSGERLGGLDALKQGMGPSAVFAQPPGDLPALLRLADQLESLAKQGSGERALVWQCSCGARYAVPIGLVRSVSILCERCTNPLDLSVERSIGEENLVDPFQASVNDARVQLARFFREAMARGWPVLVSAHPGIAESAQ